MQRRKKKGKQRGVTFLEILAVLVILVLIYLAYSRSFGQGTDKAKLSDVQNSFKQYQIGFENSMDEASGLPSSNGINIDYSQLNKYFNKDFQIASPSNGTGSVHPTANPIQTSSMKDPWGNNYLVQAKYVSPQESLLLVRSAGKDKQNGVTNDLFYDTQSGTDTDDIVFISYFKNGTVRSCTKGLSKDLGKPNISGAGTALDPVAHDVPLSMRQPYESSYAYEYAIEAYGDFMGSARTYVYSNAPLNLVVNEDTNSGRTSITETNNRPYVGFNVWYASTDMWGVYAHAYTTPVTFSSGGTVNYLLWDNAFNTGGYIETVSNISGATPYTILGCN